MNTAAQTGYLRLVLHAVQAATEFVLAPVWGAALLFGLLVAHGPHGRDRMFVTLLWAVLETRPFLLCGLALFFGAWGLHKAGWPLWLIRIAGGLAAPALALLIARPSFYRLLDQPGYYWLAPMIFLGLFVLCALFYGASLLPRHFSPQARPRLHLHWLVLAMFLPYVSWFVLRAASPAPGPWLPLPPLTTPEQHHYGQVVFARWTPGESALAVEPFDMHLPPPRGGLIPEPRAPDAGYVSLNDEETRQLREAGVTGHVEVLGSAPLGNTGRLVLILSQQLNTPFEFRAPSEGSYVIYLQTRDGWKKIPPESGEAQSILLRVYIPDGKPNVTGFEVDSGKDWTGRDETRYFWPQ